MIQGTLKPFSGNTRKYCFIFVKFRKEITPQTAVQSVQEHEEDVGEDTG